MSLGISHSLTALVKASFIAHCLEAIQVGFNRMVADRRYELHREEDNLTGCLVETMEQTGFLADYQISVNYQTPIIGEDIAFGDADFLTAPKVDFKFSTWHTTRELKFYAEAKNVSESDWHKPSGALVSASKQRARYLATGIENFLTRRYPEGCLVGYVVNGTVAAVVTGLNDLIAKRNINPRVGLIVKSEGVPWNICYESVNVIDSESVLLYHLMLQLS